MIDIQAVEAEIRKQESKDTNYANVQRLACLYAVRNEFHRKTERMQSYAEAAAPTISTRKTSDFLAAIDGKDQKQLWLIMDELMETLLAVCPKCYTSVMRKISLL